MSSLSDFECDERLGEGDVGAVSLGAGCLMFSFDSVRLCKEPFVIEGTFSGVAFCATGLRAFLLSVLPMPDRHSSSRIFLGVTFILEGDL